uniref:DUF19 domain-containing protein n=1 Tax=Caenorhabditis tropicalis TaxID=1561998 RepID=A0A1I7UZ41_9PELO
MKVLLVLFFILSTTMATRVKRADLTEREKLDTANEVNAGRRQVAKIGNIANMNALVYSDSSPFPTKCAYKNINFPVHDYDVNFMRNLLKTKLASFKANLQDIIEQSENSAYNCINPKQEEIQCKTMECDIDGRMLHVPNCGCGLEPGFQMSDVVTGKAGSNCQIDSEDDGLCVVGFLTNGEDSGSGGSVEATTTDISSSIFSIGTLLLLTVFYLIF